MTAKFWRHKLTTGQLHVPVTGSRYASYGEQRKGHRGLELTLPHPCPLQKWSGLENITSCYKMIKSRAQSDLPFAVTLTPAVHYIIALRKVVLSHRSSRTKFHLEINQNQRGQDSYKDTALLTHKAWNSEARALRNKPQSSGNGQTKRNNAWLRNRNVFQRKQEEPDVPHSCFLDSCLFLRCPAHLPEQIPREAGFNYTPSAGEKGYHFLEGKPRSFTFGCWISDNLPEYFRPKI